MCESHLCAGELAEEIQESPNRWGVFQKITGLDTDPGFDLDCVATLVEVLSESLNEANKLEQSQSWSSLYKVAVWYPSIVVEEASHIETRVSEGGETELENFGQLVEILVDTRTDLSSTFSLKVLESLCEAEDASVRRAAVEALSQNGSYDALKRLINVRGYEVPRVVSAANDGIDEITTDTLNRLAAATSEIGEPGDTREAERLIIYLARHLPEHLVGESARLHSLLGSKEADAAVTAMTILLRTEAVDTSGLRSRLTETVSEINSESTARDRLEAEQSIEALARSNVGEDDTVYMVQQWGQWLESDDPSLREHALTQLGTMADENPDTVRSQMDRISQVISEGSSEFAPLAKDVLSSYSHSEIDDIVTYVQRTLEAHDAPSAVENLAEVTGALSYRPEGEMSYEQLTFDETCLLSLGNLWSSIEDARTVPVVWPLYSPRVSVLLSLEVLFRFLSSGEDVVLLTGGGGSHWGNLTEVRSEYARYGLQSATDDQDELVSLKDVIPHARISDGEIEEVSNGTTDTRFVITKRAEELKSIDSAGCILLNLTSRVKPEYDEVIDELIETFPETPIIPIYSQFVKHETDERRVPRYGPPAQLDNVDTLPGVDALSASLDAKDSIEGRPVEFPGHVADDLRDLSTATNVRIVEIEDDGLMDYLEPGYRASAELRDHDENRVAGRIFSTLLQFERMPLPYGQYDQWARAYTEGFFGPRQISVKVDKLEAHGMDTAGTGTARSVLDSVEGLRRALNTFDETNPMYDALIDEIRKHRDEGDSLTIFLPKSTWRKGVRDILLENGVIKQYMIQSGSVSFVDPDSVRSLSSTDTLLFLGPQRPQYAGFYTHPQAQESVVLTYPGGWDRMIESDARGYVDRLNEALSGTDYEPIEYPEVDVEPLPDPKPEQLSEPPEPSAPSPQEPGSPGPREPSAPEPRATADTGSTSNKSTEGTPRSRTNRSAVAELFDQDRSRDYSSEGGDRYDEYTHADFDVTTVDGPTLTGVTRVLKRREVPTSSDGRYHWISPRNLDPGDEIAIIDDDVYQSFWSEWLGNTYSEELGDTSVIDDIETWYETVMSIINDLSEGMSPESPRQSLSTVRRRVLASTPHIDREDQTIWNWFRSVDGGESGLDLVETPSLTIGPQNAKDMHKVGDAFGYDTITGENARRIEQSMRRARSVNASQGHEFADHLKQKMNSLETNDVRDAAERHVVQSVTKNQNL